MHTGPERDSEIVQVPISHVDVRKDVRKETPFYCRRIRDRRRSLDMCPRSGLKLSRRSRFCPFSAYVRCTYKVGEHGCRA